nr:Ca2+ sensor EF-Hand superfamily [Ipomoea batatas]GME15908.1 Ca2+ sensor EF-Hand superfamily [Ipomoea batatas]
MEDLSKAANYYLETASEGYKKRAQKAIDDGQSLEDFYVRETKRCIRKCDVCSELVVGFYFCCTKCELFMAGYNYNLCVDCFYGGRTFEHEHDTFADNHSVLMMHTEGRGEPSCVIEQNNGKGKQDSNSEDDASSSHSKSSIPHDSSFKDSNFTFTHHDSSNHSKSTYHDDSSSHCKSTQTMGSGSSSTAIEKRNRHGDDVVAALKVGQAIINTGAAVLSIASALGACTIM